MRTRQRKRRKNSTAAKWIVAAILLLYPLLAVYWLTARLVGGAVSGISSPHGEPVSYVTAQNGVVGMPNIVITNNGELLGDPQPLLQFVIAGHGKAGTTSLQEWLSPGTASTLTTKPSNQIYIPPGELLELSMGTNREFIERIYEEYKSHPGFQLYGYKNPGEIRNGKSIRFLSHYFPKTVLIVGIRHPIRWFESLYNFKVQNLVEFLPSDYWGDPNTLIGKCEDPAIFDCVGTHKGLFHVHLAMLGKTPNTQPLETKYARLLSGNVTKTFNPVFLLDVDQLRESSNVDGFNRTGALAADLTKILNLPSTMALGPPPQISPGKTLPKRLQRERNKAKIDICDDHYMPLRSSLLEMSQEISSWLRTSGFLDHPDVHVSSRDFFVHEILEKRWMRDPCQSNER